MGCSCFPRELGEKYIAKEKRYLARPLPEEISKVGRQQPHSTAHYWCGTLLVWVLVSHPMPLVNVGSWEEGLQQEDKCSLSQLKKKSVCHLENVAMKGLGFAFFPPTFCLLPNLTWIQIWVGKLKRLSPFLKGNCCTPVHLSPPDLKSCSDTSNSGYF